MTNLPHWKQEIILPLLLFNRINNNSQWWILIYKRSEYRKWENWQNLRMGREQILHSTDEKMKRWVSSKCFQSSQISKQQFKRSIIGIKFIFTRTSTQKWKILNMDRNREQYLCYVCTMFMYSYMFELIRWWLVCYMVNRQWPLSPALIYSNFIKPNDKLFIIVIRDRAYMYITTSLL